MRTLRPGADRHRAAFSLVEAMMVIFLGSMLAAATIALFTTQRRSMHAMEQLNELQMNTRIAMDLLTREVGMAGYGIPVHDDVLGSWVTWVPGLNANPEIIKGTDSLPDSITIVGAFDRPSAFLSAATTNGQTVIALQSGQTAQFNTSNRKLVYIGRQELARIVSVGGGTLTVSTSPTQNQPLRIEHAAGSPVELVRAVTYSCIQDTRSYPYRPHLIREDYLGTLPFTWQRIVAGGIENLRFDREEGSKLVSIEIHGRSSRRDAFFVDRTGPGDGYRRSTISTTTRLVNLP